jgi:hypothetical protein
MLGRVAWLPASRWRTFSAILVLRTIARRAVHGDSDNRQMSGCYGSRKHPSHHREDTRELLRTEITRDRKRAVRLPERISFDAMLLEKRTYNAARGDQSSVKS